MRTDPPQGTHPVAAARYGAVLALLLLVVSCGASGERFPARGTIAGEAVRTTVDSRLAQYALARTRPGAAPDAALEARLAEVCARYDGQALDAGALQRLSAETSVDFAALYFVERVLAIPGLRPLQARFRGEVARLRTRLPEPLPAGAAPVAAQGVRFLFVPGWLYRDDPSTGADFAAQRRLLQRLGYDARLVPIDENGTVDANAARVAAAVRRHGREARALVLISTSKGGAEVAIALGDLLSGPELRRVAAWISVGGIHRGTYLADLARAWPRAWLAGTLFFLKGLETDSIDSMTTAALGARMETLRFPGHIAIYQYVGVPLSGSVSPQARDGYEDLRPHGPNDGLTLLADELLPGARIVLAPGQDHFFRDAEIDLKTLAMVRIVLKAPGLAGARGGGARSAGGACPGRSGGGAARPAHSILRSR